MYSTPIGELPPQSDFEIFSSHHLAWGDIGVAARHWSWICCCPYVYPGICRGYSSQYPGVATQSRLVILILDLKWVCIQHGHQSAHVPKVFVFTPFVILLGWVGSIVAGHTKRMPIVFRFFIAAFNVMWCEFQGSPPMLSFSVHMLLVTQLVLSCGRKNINHGMTTLSTGTPDLQSLKHPFFSNHVPWAVIAACIGTCAILILSLRYLLHFENIRRDGEQRDETYDDIYLMQESEDGTMSEKPVDKVQISITFKPHWFANYVIKIRLSLTSQTFRTVISDTRCRLCTQCGLEVVRCWSWAEKYSLEYVYLASFFLYYILYYLRFR